MFVGVQGLVDVQVNLRPLAGGKWDILLFILFFGSQFGSLNPKNWPKPVEFLVLGVPTLAWVPSPKRNPKNRLLDTPVCIITFYNIQPKNVNRNIHIPRLHLPTAHLRNRPEVSRLRPEANSADHRRITAHSIITRPRTSPLASPSRCQPGHGGPDSSNNQLFGQGRLNTPDRPTQPAASVRIHPTIETRS